MLQVIAYIWCCLRVSETNLYLHFNNLLCMVEWQLRTHNVEMFYFHSIRSSALAWSFKLFQMGSIANTVFSRQPFFTILLMACCNLCSYCQNKVSICIHSCKSIKSILARIRFLDLQNTSDRQLLSWVSCFGDFQTLTRENNDGM